MYRAYRTLGLPRGALNAIGSLHIHIDASGVLQKIMEVVQVLESAYGCPGKFNHVYAFIAGQQREVLPDTYLSHTPTLGEREELDFFSTSLMRDRLQSVELLDFVMERIAGIPGTVVELEQVIARFDVSGWTEIHPDKIVSKVRQSEIISPLRKSLPIEIHYGFDLPKTLEPLLSLDPLKQFCEDEGIVVGGWFVFEKSDCWAYRSNAFVKGKRTTWRALVEEENAKLESFLASRFESFHLRTHVEKVLALCRTSSMTR